MGDAKLKWDEVLTLSGEAPPWWNFFAKRFDCRYGPVWERVQQVLAARVGTWTPDNDIHTIICVIAGNECDYEQPLFDLDDDLRIAFWSYTDGLNTEFAFIELEDEYEISFLEEEIAEAMDGTVGELIHRIEAKLTAKAGAQEAVP